MNLRRRRHPLLVMGATIVFGGTAIAALTAAGDEPPVRREHRAITVVDGPDDDQRVTLDTTFFPPATGGRAPAVLLAHGFGGSKASVRFEAEALSRAGYAVLTWSARGFGRSTGQIALNSPDYEVKDVRQLIDWLAHRPEVRLDRPGDPRVGIAGRSYGGAISLLAAAHDQRVDAIAPQITWYDLADSLFPNAAKGGGGAAAGVFKKLWAGLFFTAGGAGLDGADGGGAGSLGLGGGTPGASGGDRTSGSAGGPGEGPGGGPGAGPGGGPGEGTDTDIGCGRFLPELCEMYQRVAERGRPDAEAVDRLRRSSPSSVAGRIRVPTLLVQGQSDSLFPLEQSDANATAIARTGAPVHVVWFQGGHDGGAPETDRVRGLVHDWFDRWLKRGASGDGADPNTDPNSDTDAGAGFTVTRVTGVDPTTRDIAIAAAAAPRYPGLTGGAVGASGAGGATAGAQSGSRRLPLRGDEQSVHNPAGGSPSSISALPGLGALAGLDAVGGGFGLALDMPGQSAEFDSPAVSTPLRVTGAPSVRLRVSGADEVTLFAKLYDVSPQGVAVPARRLASPLRVTGAEDGRDVDVTLPAIDHRVERGHRLRVVITSTDLGYATSGKPVTYRVAATGPLAVPIVSTLRPTGGTLPIWVRSLPLTALVIAFALLVTGRRRGNRSQDGNPARGGSRGRGGSLGRSGTASQGLDPTLADVPLRISGLTKRYAGGQLAVDDVSFQVERGQVLGLLGPNGAGKTTTLRMLMGLIHPDAGEIRIFGHRVTPGARVLSRLGSFVEGPGFLPHLSGRDNLDLYWRATGRPRADAHFEEAIEVAGLGPALDRAVRTYSQGMRQRLAIAQAMLGLPDLLVLDEPTNGLDPPQIREMRGVLARYAREGRTVVVSSHLLAEVEQTCTHVVVMHRGTAIARGPVPDIVGHGAGLIVGTTEVDRALEVVKALDGIEAAEPVDSGVLIRLDGSEPSAVVAELVAGGVPIDGVIPHRRLEDAFLALIGEGHNV